MWIKHLPVLYVMMWISCEWYHIQEDANLRRLRNIIAIQTDYTLHVVLHIRCIMWYKNGREPWKQLCREVSRNKSHPRYVVVLRFREVKIEDEMRKIRRQGILLYDLSTVSRIDGRKECSAQWNASDSKCMTLLSEEHAELSERERETCDNNVSIMHADPKWNGGCDSK